MSIFIIMGVKGCGLGVVKFCNPPFEKSAYAPGGSIVVTAGKSGAVTVHAA